MQGQCNPNAIELARIAEVQPVLADFIGKVRQKINVFWDMRQLPVFAYFTASFHYDSASILRQNRIFHDVPKRIAQLPLRIALHAVVHLATIHLTYLTPHVLSGVLAKVQFQGQSLRRNLIG